MGSTQYSIPFSELNCLLVIQRLLHPALLVSVAQVANGERIVIFTYMYDYNYL